jgi:hypothetical protein
MQLRQKEFFIARIRAIDRIASDEIILGKPGDCDLCGRIASFFPISL